MKTLLIHIKRVSGSAFLLILLIVVACTSIPENTVVSPYSRNNDPEPVTIQPGYSRSVTDEYAGSVSCRECHGRIFQQWSASPHGKPLKPSDYRDPPHQGSCKRCHFTGRNEAGVGCEACHGPMALHAGNPQIVAPNHCIICDVQKECIQCHNRGIDPMFDAEKDWKRVNHGSQTN